MFSPPYSGSAQRLALYKVYYSFLNPRCAQKRKCLFAEAAEHQCDNAAEVQGSYSTATIPSVTEVYGTLQVGLHGEEVVQI